MTRVMFVDDEERVLRGLRRSLKRAAPDGWDVTYAAGGEEALALLEEARFDVVVSDARMPQVDGPELLRQVRARWPRTIRMILSGQTDEADALRALQVAHQFLQKPCPTDLLVETVQQSLDIQRRLNSPAVEEFLAGVDQIPATPRVYQQLSAVMVDREVSLARVARIIGDDPSLAAKVLQTVNSAFFSLRRRILDIEEAVGFLGLEVVRTLVLQAELANLGRSIRGFDMVAYEDRVAWLTGLTRHLAPPDVRAAAASAAVLVDVGELLLAMSDAEAWADLARATPYGSEARQRAELAAYGVSHDDAGAALLQLWAIPTELVTTTLYHHHPARMSTPDKPTALVHVASELTSWVALGRPDPGPKIDGAAVAAAGLPGDPQSWIEALDDMAPDAAVSS